MPWRGYNFEDAIIISERLVYDDEFSSIHIEEFELQSKGNKERTGRANKRYPRILAKRQPRTFDGRWDWYGKVLKG